MATSWPIDVLFEDNHLLAVNKPAMLPTMGVGEEKPSLLASAREYIRTKYAKPGNVYLGVVSRLDAPVTGLVLLAKTSKAAARLSEAFRLRRVDKSYLAVVEGLPDPTHGALENYLRKDERHRKMHVTHPTADGAQLARLQYRRLSAARQLALLEIALETGRKHQIRVQLSKAGHPIVGDRKYGAALPFPRGIALHAFRLAIEHPVRKERLELTAPIPAAWRGSEEIAALLERAEIG